jgi:hypothetical protein
MHSGDERATILEFIRVLQGDLSVAFEEGTSAAWLHDLLKPHVAHLAVCDLRKNALLEDGSKSDTASMRESWRSCYVAISSNRCTTESTGYEL